jgi:subtilisin family serine protease
LTALAAGLLLAGCGEDGSSPIAPAPEAGPAGAAASRAAHGKYIVVFRDDVRDVPGLANALVRQHGGSLVAVYQHALRGFGASLPPAAVEALARNPQVAYVEPEIILTGSCSSYISSTPQCGAPWGLDRVDARNVQDGVYDQFFGNGAGVNVYVLDSGIRFSHAEFGGRAVSGYDFVSNDSDASDCFGHGTQVAGNIGGATYGVAKSVQLVSVRVLDCSNGGSSLGVVSGIDWVTANHAKPAVANMSLGGSVSTAIDAAVRRSISAGITYVVAAGNSNISACNVSPARVGEAVTVGASNSSDARWVTSSTSASNFGTCLDMFAPGQNTTSAAHTGDTDTRVNTGTSFASPHAAGAAALLLANYPSYTPAQVQANLKQNTSDGYLSNIGTGSPNKLLYVGLFWCMTCGI